MHHPPRPNILQRSVEDSPFAVDAQPLFERQEPGVSVLQVAAAAPRPTLNLVIDTNVVLDWLAFSNPIGTPLKEALISGQFRWLRTRLIRDEFAHVIARESLARWAIDADAVLAVYDAHAVDVGTPPLPSAGERLHCADPDDQPFVDLAIAERVHALLTRDRGLLRLAASARRFNVLIATPEVWLRQHGLVARPGVLRLVSSTSVANHERPALASRV